MESRKSVFHFTSLAVGLYAFIGSISTITSSDVEVVRARLVGGHDNTTGRVEVSRNGSVWGTVCDDLWTDKEAQVVCRQLGYKWGASFTGAAFGEGVGEIFLDNVQCTGTEKNLGECQHNGWGNNNCRHYEDAGVACYNSSVKLKSRGRTDVGTVEIRTDDGWVEVCDQDWDPMEAHVVCREMGYTSGFSQCCSILGVDQSMTGPNKAYTQFACKGMETNLLDCPHVTLKTKCAPEHRASAICYHQPLAKVDRSFAVRLDNGSDPNRYWGEVNVRNEGVWGQVCAMGDNWNDKAATVVCKQLKFKAGKAYGTVNETLTPHWIIDMNCTGSESSLQECAKQPWGQPSRSCKPAYALCYNKEVSVNLRGGGDYYGRVEITHDGHTGTICDKAWSTSDARVVCKQLGYADGDPVTGSFYGKGTGPVMMNGMGCYGYESNIVNCRNKGWMSYQGTSCDDHKNDASVICYKNVRLSRGDHSHGVVQIMEDNWSVLCGEGFGNKEAQRVCYELGFQNGIALAMGSFGTFYGKYVRPNVTCVGNESSILNCTYDKFRACQKDAFLGYAVVSCFNGTLNKEPKLKLEGSEGTDMANQTGRVVIQQYGIWGRVCPNAWDDKDADVVCRNLGYLGGVAYKYTSSGYGPYTLGMVGCHGNESTLFDCPVSPGLCDAQFSSGDAGVLCYTVKKPALRLVGSANTGHLEIILDTFTGTICDFGWSRYDASVACKQLGFQDGEPRSSLLSSTGATVVMSSMGCYGGESSIFMCRNPGWQKNINEKCYEANRNAGVFCYNHVRISGGQADENTTAGKVEMYHHGNWITVCADGFNDTDARLVCRELGFPNSKALVPGAFGRKYYSDFVTDFNCTGSEISIALCPFNETGECLDKSSNYASVLCSKFPIDNNAIYILPFESFPATVAVKKHGMNGTICAEGWDNKDADVLCRQLGYSGGGVSFGPQYSGSSTPIWMTNVNCYGNETRIQDCRFLETPTSGCLSNHMAARVYCYEGPGFQVRLVNGSAPSNGRVEVSYGGTWGTICDSYWSDSDARVVCRQLGFLDGVAQANSYYGAGMGPSWLYYVRCDGDEKSIWSCTNSGFNVSHTSCRNHKHDASVYCTDRVRLEPNVSYGAVQIWNREAYRLVCADGFDDLAAKVVCRSAGFQNGISVCCSAFGEMKYDIGYRNVRCTGNEMSILDCSYVDDNTGCSSGKYASVACSDQPANGEYALKLKSYNRGTISLRHFDIWGYICADGFDDAEATVICREMGFQGGFSYFEMKYDSSKTLGIPWLTNVNCTGQEGSLVRCGNIRWGSVEQCKSGLEPAVFCYQNSGYKFRLANGTSLLSGRVEISLDNEWGTVCGTSKFDDKAAHVLCSEMGYTSGRSLDNGYFGEGKGKIMIPYIRCAGNESSLLKCGIKIEPEEAIYENRGRLNFVSRSTYYTCRTHAQDAAVQCYNQGLNISLQNGTNHMNGRIQFTVDDQVGSFCGWFDDDYAQVVCRQLNYTSGRALDKGTFGSQVVGLHISTLKCDGSERTILQCPLMISGAQASQNNIPDVMSLPGTGGWYRAYHNPRDCYHSNEDAAVQCYKSGFTFNLAYGNNPLHGQVRFTIDNQTGSFCGTFNDSVAMVVCRQMGFVSGKSLLPLLTSTGSGNYQFTNVACIGNENSFTHCSFKIIEKDFKIQTEGSCGSCSPTDASCLRSCYMGLRYNRMNMDPCYIREQPLTVQCYTTGLTFNLAYGNNLMHGQVRFTIDNQTGSFCGTFNDSVAMVVCRQMGFVSGKSLLPLPTSTGSVNYQFTNVACVGNESSFTDCSFKILDKELKFPTDGSCSSACYRSLVYNRMAVDPCYITEQPLTVQCSSTVRLSGTSDLNYGILELYVNGQWKAVCDEHFTESIARVACRQLGYKDGRFQPGSVLGPNESDGISITDLRCNGDEASLDQCKYLIGECHTSNYVTVYCNESIIVEKSTFDIRISSGLYYGSLEVNKYGFWGPICPHGWSNSTARAACRQLNYIGGVAYNGTSRVEAPMVLGNFKCSGDENSAQNLSDCKYSKFNDNIGCQYSIQKSFQRPTAGVLCYNHEEGVKFRLDEEGRVQIMFNGEWGRVCNSSWGNKEAGVFCRQQGYIDGITKTFSSRHDGHVWMNYIACTGNENTILECTNTWTPGSANCDDAGVTCLKSVMLTRGDYKSHGAVEVNMNNHWGLVCNKDWDQKDVDVVCRQLGFETGFPLHNAPYGYIKAPGTMEAVQCNGNEKKITDCPHNIPYVSMCSMDYAAAACFNRSTLEKYSVPSFSIAGNRTLGVVEVSYLNITGRVCSEGWDDLDATVLCKQLGFYYGQAYSHYKWSTGRGENAPFWTSQVNCSGKETSLDLCPMVKYGQVQDCPSRNYAGVLCYQKYGVDIRIMGGGNEYGRVEISVDGVWGTVCNRYWDLNDAKVLCRSLGYKTGYPLYTGKFGPPPDKIYAANLHCNGSEDSLRNCSHEGFEPSPTDSNCDHSKDAAVNCYNSVKLGSGVGKHITNGPVLYFDSTRNVWEAVCDKGFNDNSATLVCKELGFDTGRAILSSAFGTIHEEIFENNTLSCSEDATSIDQCLMAGQCNQSDSYASVACYMNSDLPLTEDYSYSIEKGSAGDYSGVVSVRHYGLFGKICSEGWDDIDASVLCRNLTYQHGIAFPQADNDFSPLMGRGPYWMSDVKCTGHEPSLNNCVFKERLDEKNCSSRMHAAVLCYNDNGIDYRIVNDKNPNVTSEGRVEISINKVWGTVCDASWDDYDARVFCRQQNFHDGYAIKGGYFGESKVSPIWMSHLKCAGTEASLDKCPHRGFNSGIVDGSLGWWKCKSHKDDAGVLCVNNLKLSGEYNSSMGAVLVYHNNDWYAVCDDSFNSLDARVVCRSLGFIDGNVSPGSAFGNVSSPIGVNSVQCKGGENVFNKCSMEFSSSCPSGKYASVYCSQENIVDKGFQVRINPDYGKSMHSFHGYMEVNVDGVWGSVCNRNWTDKNAFVACRQMGYAGGYAYRPPKNISNVILMDNVGCRGDETSLLNCTYNKWEATTGCDFYAERAGVFCFSDTNGLKYRLGSGETKHGRVEIMYNGVWGSICDWLWDSRDARVFCRSIGFEDGLEVVGARYGQVEGPLWFTRVSCDGYEDSLLQCRHTGFNSSSEMEGVYAGLCRKRSYDASARCFDKKLELTNVRLVNIEGDPTYGRVEVYLAGAEEWGTVCDDYWDDVDATVVCQSLGFGVGHGVKGAHFGRGKGPVWLDNVRCTGNETHIRQCPHNSFAVQNCNHGEDAGVYCKGNYTRVLPITVGPEGVGRTEVADNGLVKEELRRSEAEQSGSGVIIGVTVTIIAVLIAVIVVGGVIIYRRTRPKGEIKKVLVHNDANDPNPVVNQSGADGRVTLSKLKAHFSKSKLNSEIEDSGASANTSAGVANPVYVDDRNQGIIMEEASIEQPTHAGYDI